MANGFYDECLRKAFPRYQGATPDIRQEEDAGFYSRVLLQSSATDQTSRRAARQAPGCTDSHHERRPREDRKGGKRLTVARSGFHSRGMARRDQAALW